MMSTEVSRYIFRMANNNAAILCPVGLVAVLNLSSTRGGEHLLEFQSLFSSFFSVSL